MKEIREGLRGGYSDRGAMKIAVILSENERFSVQGGANARKAFEIFRRFSKRHRIEVFSGTSGRTAYAGTDLIHKRVRSGGLRKLCKYLYRYEIAMRVGGGCDVMYVLNRPEFVPVLRRFHPGVKVVLHMGNDHLADMEEGTGRHVVDGCDLIIAISEHVRAGILRKYPEAGEKVRLVHNGVDAEAFCPESGARERKEVVVLYVGRLCAEKGVHDVISAMMPILGRMPAARLRIVGSSWFGEEVETAYVRKLKEMAAPAGGRIEFAGCVANDRVAEAYRGADIFVSPSVWNEPFCNTNLEAMASGLAVVSTRRGGIPEVVGDAGILVDAGDTGELGAQLELLISNAGERRRFAEAGRRRAVKYFDWERISGEIEREVVRLARVEKVLGVDGVVEGKLG